MRLEGKDIGGRNILPLTSKEARNFQNNKYRF